MSSVSGGQGAVRVLSTPRRRARRQFVEPYSIALIQSEIQVVVREPDRNEVMSKNFNRIVELLDWVFTRIGAVKLAITPEYCLMGQYRPRTVEEWRRIALPIPNEFTERAGEVAAKYDCY